MKRILYSAASIVFIGVLAYSATGAFFSDTETSTANVFAAGDIDLQIDNESYAIDFNIPGYQNPTGALVENPANSWEMADLVSGVQKFFNFSDVKPGDYGEDTISIHVGSNDAWMCAAARITADLDNDITEPEDEMSGANNDENDGTTDGDLDSELNFAFWADDGDNVFESDETTFLTGTLADMNSVGQIALADSQGGAFGNDPVPGGETVYIGKMWCAGDLTPNPVAPGNNSPLHGTGWTCDGSDVSNIAQTDSVQGDMQFYAVQARNNTTFTCAEDYDPSWPTEEEVVGWVETAQTGGDATEIATSTNSGSNALQLTTINDTASRVRYTYDIVDVNASTSFTGFSFDSKQVSAADMVNGNATFRLVVDLDGNLATMGDVTDVTYEPYYNIAAHNALNDASIVPGAWQNWEATMSSGKFWAAGVTTVLGPSEGAGGAYATNFTIQQLVDAYPNAKITAISIGMGTWNVNQVVLVDNLIFNGVNLGFE